MNNETNSNPFDEGESTNSTSAFADSDLKPIEDETSGRTFVWLILGVTAIGCGILFAIAFIFFQPDAQSLVDKYFPSPTPTLTRTPTPTPTPNLTATQQVIQATSTAQAIQTTIAEAASQWDIVLSDEFTANKNEWATGNDDDEYAKIDRTINNNVYQWDATAKKGFVAWITPNVAPLTYFYLSAKIQRTEGSTASDYGLVFREDSKSNFYYFGVDDNNFHVSLSYDNEWIDIVEWTPSSAVIASAQNRLTVIAQGSHFIFLINNQVVAEAVDTHLPKGTVGLAIQIYEPELKAIFEFDDFELRTP
jgi:hypothetical protein